MPKHHHPDTKAQALARVVSGESVLKVAADMEIPTSTLYEWTSGVGGIDLIRQSKVEDLVFDYLKENLETLAAQCRHARDLDWLKGQNASDLAVLHGVMSDKSTRILAAVERAHAARPAGSSLSE